jgi:hypothetical protein
LGDQRALRIGLLLVDGVGRRELFVACEVVLGVGEQRLVLRLLGGCLIECRLERGRVDLRQHVALLDVLAFLEADAEQFAVDLRPHRDGVECLGGADGVEIDRHVGERGGRDQHRHRAVGGETAGAALLLRRRAEDVIERAGDGEQHYGIDYVTTTAASGTGQT